MRIIQVCSFFNTSSLYRNLFNTLRDQGLLQDIFIPIYRNKPISPSDYGTVKKREESSENLKYIYDECLNTYQKYMLYTRVKKMYKSFNEHISYSENDLLHAHSLFANGGIAYLAKKERNCKYIVSFRQTDYEVYKKLKYYRGFAKKIILEAENIIFISHSLRNKFLKLVKDDNLLAEINKKGMIIPNGIPASWLRTETQDRNNFSLNGEIKFLYQGTLHARKNIDYIIDITELLNNQGLNVSLQIVGGGPEKENLLKRVANSPTSEKIKIKNWTDNPSEIIESYRRNSIFIMPSKNETFGIAYLEALAMGLPIIYKENDGIDGFFDDVEVGVALSLENIEEDVEKIKKVINNYDVLSKNTSYVIEGFSWQKISNNYIRVYEKLLKNK